MQSFAIRAPAAGGFRLTLDLSAWADVGLSLAPAVIRVQLHEVDAPTSAPVLEFATGAANPATFDPETGLMAFAAPATATAALAGDYAIAARAEFASSEIPLFGGAVYFISNVESGSPSSGLPASDTAWISAHQFGPAPVPAPLAAAVSSAQSAARDAMRRAMLFG